MFERNHSTLDGLDSQTSHPTALLGRRGTHAKCSHPGGGFREFTTADLQSSVVACFERQVERHSDRLAVKLGDQQLSYDELNRAANQVAWRLLSDGGDGSEPVALLFESAVPALVTMLGVLKAGKFYVPIELSQPRTRMMDTLRDSHARWVLTDREHRDVADGLIGSTASTIVINDLAGVPTENIGSTLGPENLAFVTYTSGSSSQSRGVLYDHAGILYQVYLDSNVKRISCHDRLSLVRPYSYNGAVKDIYCALLNGASLFPFDVKRNGTARMAEWMRRERITVWNSVVTTFRQFLQSVTDSAGFPDLRSVLIGGETITWRDVELFQEHCPSDCVLTINYGITETVGAICQNHIGQQSTMDGTTVPVGYPVALRKVLLLDDAGHGVPVGEVGEIAVRSRYLAVGYWNRPDLTERAFLPDPAGGSERIYRTGDLGILAPDGCLTHLGRKDARVKIRGHVVDLAETERLLVGLPTVREAAVVARTDRHGQVTLAAYVVAVQPPGPSVTEWRGALAERLPEHMIPDIFVKLDSLPRTLGNKVDRTALPEPGTQRPDLETLYRAPRNPLEELLVRLWEDVLEIAPIGVDDNFFELGGNSLQAMRFINRIQDELDAYLYIIGVFDAPSIAQFAEYLKADYRDSLIQRFGPSAGGADEATPANSAADEVGITAEKLALVHRSVATTRCWADSPNIDEQIQPANGTVSRNNQRALFVFSPTRSGSTLLRVMLAGHPQLFAPPELSLLAFDTMRRWNSTLIGRFSPRREGVLYAVMSALGCDQREAERRVQASTAAGDTVAQFYDQLQTWIAPRTLVDKTPSYVVNLETLRRAELLFEDPVYIHLTRHPIPSALSFAEIHNEQSLISRPESLTPCELAECLWLISHRNILNALKDVPAHRQIHVQFEDLVKEPALTIERLCQFLGLSPHPDMFRPYDDRRRRMTDGIHAESTMIGDPKFHTHDGIDPRIADRWMDTARHHLLFEETWQMAERLGYARVAKSD